MAGFHESLLYAHDMRIQANGQYPVLVAFFACPAFSRLLQELRMPRKTECRTVA